MDKEKATQYILQSQSYDGAIGQAPLQEGHAGSTFCALASLTMMGTLDKLPHKDRLLKWLINRQGLGFCGRPNKLEDTCYSFWVGGSLNILECFHVVEANHTRSFTRSCQQRTGGCAKWSDCRSDVLHTYMAFCGLSFINEPGFAKVHTVLCLPQHAVDHLHTLHERSDF